MGSANSLSNGIPVLLPPMPKVPRFLVLRIPTTFPACRRSDWLEPRCNVTNPRPMSPVRRFGPRPMQWTPLLHQPPPLHNITAANAAESMNGRRPRVPYSNIIPQLLQVIHSSSIIQTNAATVRDIHPHCSKTTTIPPHKLVWTLIPASNPRQ